MARPRIQNLALLKLDRDAGTAPTTHGWPSNGDVLLLLSSSGGRFNVPRSLQLLVILTLTPEPQILLLNVMGGTRPNPIT